MKGKCPHCSAEIPINKSAKVGYITYCPNCGFELEIINLNPVELDFPIMDDDFDENSYDFVDEENYLTQNK